MIILKQIHNFLSAQTMEKVFLAVESEASSDCVVNLKAICVQYKSQGGIDVSENSNGVDVEWKNQILRFFGLIPTIRLSFIGEKDDQAEFKLKTYAVPITEPSLALLAILTFYMGGLLFLFAIIKQLLGDESSMVATSGQLFFMPIASWLLMLFFTSAIRVQKLIFSNQLKALIDYSKTNLTCYRLI